jgi:adenylate cyclase
LKTATIAPEVQEILRSQEMRGERVVNNIRFAFYLLSLGMMAGVWQINTPAANRLFMVQICSVLAYSVLLWFWFRRRGDEYAPWVKYVSITVDITALHFGAVAMSVNHAGILEYFQSYVSLVLVLWNLLSALRYSVVACMFSGALSLCLSSFVLYFTVSNNLIEVSPVTVYGQPAINLGDEILRMVFIAMPAFVAAVIARISRNLILRAEEESLSRAQAEQQKEQLSRYVSKDVAEFIFKDPASMSLGGARKDATVFFSDIRNLHPALRGQRAGGGGGAAQRVLHRDGGHRLQVRRHPGQVPGRRADGAVRGAL